VAARSAGRMSAQCGTGNSSQVARSRTAKVLMFKIYPPMVVSDLRRRKRLYPLPENAFVTWLGTQPLNEGLPMTTIEYLMSPQAVQDAHAIFSYAFTYRVDSDKPHTRVEPYKVEGFWKFIPSDDLDISRGELVPRPADEAY